MWRDRQFEGPIPHGGAFVIVQSDLGSTSVVITKFDARGMVLLRFE